MSDLLSGQISFSGLGSGTDFGTIVEQLKQVESIPMFQMQSKRDTYKKRIDAVDEIIEAMQEARTKLNDLRSKDNFVKKDLSYGDDSFFKAKASGEAKDGNYRVEIKEVAERSSLTTTDTNPAHANKKSAIGADGFFEYSVGDGTTAGTETRKIKVTADMTLEQLQNVVNNDPNNAGMNMILNERDGKVSIGFSSKETGANQEIKILDGAGGTGANVLGVDFSTAGAGISTSGKDAEYSVDGFPMTSASNDVTIAEGVDIEIFNKGATTVSIKTDKEALKEGIQEFLDAINSVISEIDSKTNINAKEKEVKDDGKSGRDPNEDMISAYLDELVSGKATVSGNVLTGEYGVNSLDSRISSILSGLAPGFSRKDSNDDYGGDTIATLAEMGIKINGVEGSANFGLFEIAPASAGKSTDMQLMDQRRFDDYIDNNLDEVIDFFVADEKIETSSTDFYYTSHIAGKTEPGVYDVKYEVDSSGNILGDVYINGKKALHDGNRGYTAAYDAGGAAGMGINITDTTAGKKNESLKIQQGKIGQMADMMNDELRPYVEDLPEQNGAINVLRNSYKESMESLDDQLWKEEARLDKWENRKKLEFARLETLLSKYNNTATSMNAQLSGLM